MGDENLRGSKRPRMVTMSEDFQLKLAQEASKYNDLKLKFDVVVKENEKLRLDLAKLIRSVHFESSSQGSVDEEDEEEMQSEKVEEGDNDVALETKIPKVLPSVEGGRTLYEKAGAADENQDSRKTGPQRGNNDKKRKSGKLIPVITTYNVNVKTMTLTLRGILGHNDFNLRVLSKTVTNVVVCTLEDYDKVKRRFIEDKISFYTFTPREKVPYSVVVRGLSGSFEEGEVLEYLRGLQIDVEILKVRKLGGDSWLVSLSRSSDLRAFHQVRYILHCRVYIGKFERRGVTQCFNCQRFGHVSSNCNMPYRCVKCGDSHGPGKCAIPPKGENVEDRTVTDPKTGQAVLKVGLPVRCINCRIEGHVASSRECPRRQALLRRAEEKRTVIGSGRPVMQGMVKKGISFATAAKSASIGSTSRGGGTSRAAATGISLGSAVSNFAHIDGDCRRFFGGGLMDCLGRIGGFVAEYDRLKDDGQRSQALLGMLMTLGRNGASA